MSTSAASDSLKEIDFQSEAMVLIQVAATAKDTKRVTFPSFMFHFAHVRTMFAHKIGLTLFTQFIIETIIQYRPTFAWPIAENLQCILRITAGYRSIEGFIFIVFN